MIEIWILRSIAGNIGTGVLSDGILIGERKPINVRNIRRK